MVALLLAIIYLCFVSLGLPDSLLGAGWPTMYKDLNVDSSFVSVIALVITLFTTLSALFTPKVLAKLETKWVVIISIILTIIGMVGFSFSNQVYFFFIFALPYGAGAGAIDAALNSYVAKHYSARVMNFLHCFYGLGAIISPNIMAIAISHSTWNDGFLYTSYIQIGILILVIATIPLWKINNKKEEETIKSDHSFKSALKTKGVIFSILALFCYCSAEGIAFLYTSTYFDTLHPTLSDDVVASFGSLVFFGLMVGRIVSGILSKRVNDKKLIRLGSLTSFIAIIFISIPTNIVIIPVIGFVTLGMGMGPIYPSIQHLVPINFGKEKSDTIIALEMGGAYFGFTVFPLIFGFMQQYISMWLFPVFVGILLMSSPLLMELSYKAIAKDGINRH